MAPARSLFVPEHFPGVPDGCVRPIARIAGGLLGASALERLVESTATGSTVSECARAVLDALNIRVMWRGEPLAQQVSRSGPLVIVGNHPFGLLDGLLSMAVLPPLRPDIKFLGHQLWQRVPNIGESVIPLHPTTGHRVARCNARSLRAALSWVRGGHALALFPAPRVATWSWSSSRVTDPTWSSLMGVLVARARAEVLPVHFAGHNSLLFLATAAMLDPLHHALLIREFLNKKNLTVTVTVGRRVAPEALSPGAAPDDITRQVRELVEVLGAGEPGARQVLEAT